MTARSAILLSKSLNATIAFIKPLEIWKTVKPYSVAFPLSHFPGLSSSNVEFEDYRISINDIRGEHDKFSLEKHGFEVAYQPLPVNRDFFTDETRIEKEYRPLMRDFLQKKLNARKVTIFEHKVGIAHLSPMLFLIAKILTICLYA